ncbi:MAG TPA: endolytic transglycosylase MltG [Clostridia bacterium]|nr:endolytic transglycosylase MltG [Clostridia bacterium]
MPDPGMLVNKAGNVKWAASFAVMLVCVMIPALTLNYFLSPPPAAGQEATVTIDPGATTKDIAETLHSLGLIRSPLYFRLMARHLGVDGLLKPGTYRIRPGATVKEILDLLHKGATETFRLTVPEGFTVNEIAKLVERFGVGPAGAFLKECTRFADEIGLYDQEESKALILQPMEGYLFPDTYVFGVHATCRDIIEEMYNRFSRVFDERRTSRTDEIGLSVHQVLTLASIVEKEARVPEERPIIAGVYINRLKRGMKLDADPTVLYAMGRSSGTLTYKDLEVDSPYNTYKLTGLPPGPICNPGEASVDSVLWARDVDYLYFVARDDGTHVFSKTLREHLNNKKSIKEARSNGSNKVEE